MRGNRLTTLPPWTTSLKALEKLDLRWNPCEIPAGVAEELEAGGCFVLT
ncbi:hypothetical protein ACWF8M_19715 [Streptomyces sp. NPDC055008]